MKHRNLPRWIFSLIYTAFLLAPLTAHAVKATEDTIKTALIYKLFDYVEWPNENGISTFRIGVMGIEDDLYAEVVNTASYYKTRGRSFEVAKFSSHKDIKHPIHLLYIGASKKNEVVKVANFLRRKGVLLVTDGSEDKKDFMINFQRKGPKEGALSFQINRSNIIFERLKLDRKIVMLGGTELDVAELFRESEYTLQKIKEELLAKVSLLSKLSNDIDNQKSALNHNVKLLSEQSSIVEAQKQKLEAQQNSLQEKEEMIVEKEKKLSSIMHELDSTSVELSTKNDQLKKYQGDLEAIRQRFDASEKRLNNSEEDYRKSQEQLQSNLAILSQSEAKIRVLTQNIADSQEVLDQRRAEIEKKVAIIDSQRTLIATISIIAVSIFSLTAALLVLNTARKKALEQRDDANRELKQLYEELERAKEKADSASHEKSRFLTEMSHEIRTPLNVILGYSELMQYSEELSDEIIQKLAVINRSGEHLFKLINDILEMSKIESGSVSVVCEHFRLQSLLSDLDSMFGARCKMEGLQFHLECSHEEPVYLFADQGKIRQILINLIGNAIKFTKEGGIGVRVKVCSMNDNKLNLLAEVEDSGVGIAEGEQSKIFGAFKQTDSGLQSGKGTGLGLMISREYARKMGGDITFSSVEGQGTLFRLELPCELGDETAARSEDSGLRPIGLAPHQPRFKILLVDDNDSNRDILKRILDPIGFILKEACNGVEAIIACDEWKPDLVLMDLRMSIMGGRDAIREIRTRYDKDILPIIVVTASAFESERREVIDIGANDYIRKPFKSIEILSKVSEWLKLEYIYEEKTTTSNLNASDINETDLLAAINRLPEALKNELRDAIDIGHAAQISKQIEEIAILEKDLAQVMRNLAREFRYEKMSELLNV